MELIGLAEKEKRRLKNALDLEERLQRKGFELIGDAQLVDGQIRFSEAVTSFLYCETTPLYSRDTELRLIEKSMLPTHLRFCNVSVGAKHSISLPSVSGTDGYFVYARETRKSNKVRKEKLRERFGKINYPTIREYWNPPKEY